MPEERRQSTVHLLRELYFNRTGILFLFMAIVSILMLVASARTKGTASQFWLALGTATIATNGYSFVQVLLTTRQFNMFLSNAIETDIQQAMARGTAEAMETFRALQAKYLPVATYQALDAPNPGFNRDLNASMSESARYMFRGLAARNAVARLSLLPHPPRDVALIIADPTKPSAVDFRARHNARGGSDVAFEKAKQDILEGIHMSIAGAYLTRRRYDRIEFGLTPIPHVDRVEICDDAVFVSRFSEDRNGGTRFPSTARFGRDSLMYQMFYRDCNSILASPYVRRLELTGDLSEHDFLAMLGDLGISFTRERWAAMKQKFEEFQTQVRSQLLL